MTYNFNYRIISINYREASRETKVCIMNESTGYVFDGIAKRNPKDKPNIALATNLAIERAVRKAISADLLEHEMMIIDQANCLDFDF